MALPSAKAPIPLWLSRALMQEPTLVLTDAARLGIDINKPLLTQPEEALAELRRDCFEFCPPDPPPPMQWPYKLELRKERP